MEIVYVLNHSMVVIIPTFHIFENNLFACPILTNNYILIVGVFNVQKICNGIEYFYLSVLA